MAKASTLLKSSATIKSSENVEVRLLNSMGRVPRYFGGVVSWHEHQRVVATLFSFQFASQYDFTNGLTSPFNHFHYSKMPLFLHVFLPSPVKSSSLTTSAHNMPKPHLEDNTGMIRAHRRFTLRINALWQPATTHVDATRTSFLGWRLKVLATICWDVPVTQIVNTKQPNYTLLMAGIFPCFSWGVELKLMSS